MTLFGTDPFDDMGRWFDRFDPHVNRSAVIALDAYRRGNDVWIHADLPGVAPEAISVNVEGGRLHISADRTRHQQPGDRVFVLDRPAGPMHRSLQLGSGLDHVGIEAGYHDGVLTIRIPLAASARARRIPITTARSGAIDVDSVVIVDEPGEPAAEDSED